jgi:hypothetical protein
MQKLALMMAVMILGMSQAHGCSISADPGSRGGRDQAEMTLLPSTWSSDGGKALMTEDIITAKGGLPVEPGGHPIGRILQQIQLGVESLARVRNEVLEIGSEAAKERPEAREYNPDLEESGQESRPRERLRRRRWTL